MRGTAHGTTAGTARTARCHHPAAGTKRTHPVLGTPAQPSRGFGPFSISLSGFKFRSPVLTARPAPRSFPVQKTPSVFSPRAATAPVSSAVPSCAPSPKGKEQRNGGATGSGAALSYSARVEKYSLPQANSPQKRREKKTQKSTTTPTAGDGGGVGGLLSAPPHAETEGGPRGVGGAPGEGVGAAGTARGRRSGAHLQPRPRGATAARGERRAATARGTSPAPLPPPAAICTPSTARPAPEGRRTVLTDLHALEQRPFAVACAGHIGLNSDGRAVQTH